MTHPADATLVRVLAIVSPSRSLRRRLLVLLVALFALVTPAAADIVYHYDELGRLRAVVDHSGESAEFSYDATGNILSVIRRPAGAVAIIEFTPKRGPVGTPVTVSGTGFDATPGSNTVTFNGTAASVTAATPTQLVVTVPAGATTGPIAVTAPGGSATSAEPFTVAAPPVPTITRFTPTLGPVGTAVTVTGTNYETYLPANVVSFAGNGSKAAVTSATATSLGVTVPTGAVSGRIRVQTPAGAATSAQDFFIPPGSYTPTDIVTTTRMAIGETQGIPIGTAGKVALVVFDAAAGQKVSVSFTSATILSTTVSLYNPDRTLHSSVSMGTSNHFLDTKTLALAGTYTLVLDAEGTYAGTLTVTLHNANDLTGTITAGGAAVPITIGTPGQNARLTFTGTSAQRVSLRATSVTIGGTTGLSILKPDGTTLAGPAGATTSGGFLDTTTLPTTGTYTVLVDPGGASTGNITLTLYDVVDVTGAITPGGAAVPVSLTTPGQNARLTFAGTATQRISLWVSNVSIAFSDVSIVKPDGTALVAPTGFHTGGTFVDTKTLPVTGTYTVVLDPRVGNTGTATLTLYDIPADLSTSITPGGAAVPITVATPGQNVALTFAGTTSQRISLRFTGVTIIRSWVSIKNPDGTTLVGTTFMSLGGLFIDTKTLGATGPYTIHVDPDIEYTGDFTATLYDVPADAIGTLTINDPAQTVTITTPGQNASLTFSGTGSQAVTVRITSNTISSVTVSLKRANGTVLATTTSGAASFNLAQTTLPATETYTVTIDPGTFQTGGLAVQVTSP
ncbi:MAG: IPT/TIG domain-containing protein [Candidatus Rokuibacteriota bacterium]